MEVPILTKNGYQGPDEAIIVIKGYLSDGSDPKRSRMIMFNVSEMSVGKGAFV